MISKGLLLGMLKPLLPKLERFLQHGDLQDGELKKSILIDVVEGKLIILIVALIVANIGGQEKFVVNRIIQQFGQEDL